MSGLIKALIPACTIKKIIKNKPVNAITHFLPIEEVNSSDHFIYINLKGRNQVSAKILPERQKLTKVLHYNRKANDI